MGGKKYEYDQDYKPGNDHQGNGYRLRSKAKDGVVSRAALSDASGQQSGPAVSADSARVGEVNSIADGRKPARRGKQPAKGQNADAVGIVADACQLARVNAGAGVSDFADSQDTQAPDDFMTGARDRLAHMGAEPGAFHGRSNAGNSAGSGAPYYGGGGGGGAAAWGNRGTGGGNQAGSGLYDDYGPGDEDTYGGEGDYEGQQYAGDGTQQEEHGRVEGGVAAQGHADRDEDDIGADQMDRRHDPGCSPYCDVVLLLPKGFGPWPAHQHKRKANWSTK